MKNYTLSNIPAIFEQFKDEEGKAQYVAEFFSYNGMHHIYSNIVGYVVDEQGITIGYMEESFIDSGSDDYVFTVVIHG